MRGIADYLDVVAEIVVVNIEVVIAGEVDGVVVMTVARGPVGLLLGQRSRRALLLVRGPHISRLCCGGVV
jgi:hypothetical protein